MASRRLSFLLNDLERFSCILLNNSINCFELSRAISESTPLEGAAADERLLEAIALLFLRSLFLWQHLCRFTFLINHATWCNWNIET